MQITHIQRNLSIKVSEHWTCVANTTSLYWFHAVLVLVKLYHRFWVIISFRHTCRFIEDFCYADALYCFLRWLTFLVTANRQLWNFFSILLQNGRSCVHKLCPSNFQKKFEIQMFNVCCTCMCITLMMLL